VDLRKIVDNAPDSIKKEFVSKNFKKGSLIISPSEKIKDLYILIEGNTEIYNQNFSGNILLYSSNDAYSCFGEVELFNDNLKPLSVLAKTDCKIILLRKNIVHQWMKLDFDFNLFLFEHMAFKLNNNSDKISQISFMTVQDRVLYSLYTHYRIGDLILFTKKQLSGEACAPLRSVNRAISRCVDEGFIVYKNKKIQICSVDKIEAYLEKLLE
jgi:CRP-like cAMP-binding protein